MLILRRRRTHDGIRHLIECEANAFGSGTHGMETKRADCRGVLDAVDSWRTLIKLLS